MIPEFGRWRWEDEEVKASLRYTSSSLGYMSPWLEKRVWVASSWVLEELLSVSPISYEVCGFLGYGLYCVEVCFFFMGFCHKMKLNFVKCHFWIYQNDHVISFCFSLFVRYVTFDLCVLNHPWLPRIKAMCSRHVNFSSVFLRSFAYVLLRTFASVHWEYWSLCGIFSSGFYIRIMLTS